MGVVTDRVAGVTDQNLIRIAEFVAGGRLSDKDVRKEGVVERVMRLFLLSGTNRQIRRITVDSARQALSLVMGLAPPQTLGTKAFLTIMRTSPDLANSLILQNGNASVSHAATQSEAVTLSRLVELSKAAARATAAIEAAGKVRDDDDSKEAGEARAAASDAPKLLALAVRVIDSARPALRASLSRATVGTGSVKARMYPDGQLADAVIARLKVRPYERIEEGTLKDNVREFASVGASHVETLRRLGPLCLWDVSAVRDFTGTCTANFNSDLFWDTTSAEDMSSMFSINMEFKGYIGTWDVSGVASMDGMFKLTPIEDSGLANWNTASLTDASHMFHRTKGLSTDLDLSGWIFGPKPDLRHMFSRSNIVDCGIGNWDVTDADTHGMLLGADAFTGSLASWPPIKVADAQGPSAPVQAFGSPRAFSVNFGAEDTQKKIARVFADALRNEKGQKGSSSQEQCAIL